MMRNAILILALGIASCEMGDRENKRALATLLGMGAGGVMAYYGVSGGFSDKFIATSLVGTGGAVVGYYLSERLLPHDREKLDSTAFKALDEAEQGQSIAWGEKGVGAWGTFKPVRDYIGNDGKNCRSYIATINIEDETQKIEEAACRLESGGWQTVTT
jgi:surface antigen